MRRINLIFLIALILGLACPAVAAGPFSIRFPASPQGCDPNAVTVVGTMQHHRIKKGDDLLELARHYDLGYTELGAMYRQWDPFLPPAGAEITIPTMWIVPNSRGNNIIVNTGAMRLYYYIKNNTQVYTYPIGMGVLDYRTPQGKFRVIQKLVHPTWHIPKELQKKYEMAEMPPGPDNPLGDYKLTLSWGDYGIHGTAMPWGVGRLVSHGCTRLYPEDIKRLWPMVPMGSSVEYIYEPALIGFRQGHIYLSVHDDVYFKIPSMILHVLNLIEQRGLSDRVDMRKVMQTVEEKYGCPVDITKQAGGPALNTAQQ
jgi:L,D-transpeptidase ErfK/SrfK